MFQDKSGFVKGLAEVVFWIGLAVIVIGAFFVGSANFLLCLVYLAVGAFAVYVSSLHTYIIGNVEGKTDYLCNKIEALESMLEQQNSLIKSLQQSHLASSTQSMYSEEQTEVDDKYECSSNESSLIKCPKCGTLNYHTETVCYACKASLVPNPTDTFLKSQQTFVCPKCGQAQRPDRDCCWQCGMRFTNAK